MKPCKPTSFPQSLANHHCVHRGMKGNRNQRDQSMDKREKPILPSRNFSANDLQSIHPSRSTHEFTQVSTRHEVLQPNPCHPTITKYSQVYPGVHASRSPSTEPLPSNHHDVLTIQTLATGGFKISPPHSTTIRSLRSQHKTERKCGASTAVRHHTLMTKSFFAENAGNKKNNSTKCTNSRSQPNCRRQNHASLTVLVQSACFSACLHHSILSCATFIHS